MNKEAIERTKARCVSALAEKDGLRFWHHEHGGGSFVVDHVHIGEWDAFTDYGSGAFVMFNGDRCFATGVGMLPTSIKGLESFMYGRLS